MSHLYVHDRRLSGIVEDGKPVARAGGFGFLEGAVWNDADRYLVFSDIPGNRMHRLNADGSVTVFRDPSNMANGNVYDLDGRLVTCEHATSRVVRQEEDGSLSVLADAYGGRELNSPNDIIVDSQGRIVFTDPTYGRAEYFGVPRPPSQPARGLYIVDPGTGQLDMLRGDFSQPNGLCLTQDERYLFVNDTERRHIRRFEWGAPKLGEGEVWAQVEGHEPGAPDGMKLDTAGNLFCCGPGGVHVFAPDSAWLGVIRVPEVVANFTWGDPDLLTLYLCASTTLYSVRVRVAGRPTDRRASRS